MGSTDQYVLFTLDDQRYSLPLARVEKVVPAVYVTPLPQAPAIVTGIIDMHGQVVPVVNLRRRFHLPDRALELTDQFILANTSRRMVALTVDMVSGVIDIGQHTIVSHGDILPSLEHITGVATREDGVILIHDLEACLSFDEEQSLEAALRAA
jgi:purine-binding chemotaxis protein CheW